MTSVSTPQVVAIEAPRRISSQRSSSVATEIEPELR
jgi:hypothetical protein